MKKAFTLIELLVVIAIIAILSTILFGGIKGCSGGAFPFGPERNLTVTVKRLYVDYDGEYSHYMVGTDQGVFEVDNSLMLGIYNADELYSYLEEEKTYNIITKGNQVTNWFMQEYPCIISAYETQGEPPSRLNLEE
jgi:prepilin-type N-terminal cleavage/methylation domain-containing protein